jgi:hypothetical protein
MSSNTSANTSDPGRIERELDTTRSRLGSHLSELQERLSPGQVVDDLMSYFRGTGGDEFTRNLVESVRANPLPAAITGIGLAWLMAANPRPRAGDDESTVVHGRVRVSGPSTMPTTSGAARATYDALMTRVSSATASITRQSGEADHAFSDRVDAAKGQALGLTRQAQESASAFGQRIQEALSAAAQTVSESASSATQSVSATMHDMRDGVSSAMSGAGSALQSAGQSVGGTFAQGGYAAQRAGGNLVSTLSGNPVLLGALGLAAGALLGALIPQSDEEEAALGGIAGQARDTARSLAQEAANRGGTVAQAVLKAGQDSAAQHGLTGAGVSNVGDLVNAAMSGDLASNAKQVAQDVLRAGDEAVRKEGLGSAPSGNPA